jgi:hypothetical protein
MTLIVREKGSDYPQCPAGIHVGVVCDAIDNGLVTQDFGGKVKQVHKVTLRWQVDEINPQNGKRFDVQKRYTFSLNEKATLRKDIEALRGRPLTKDELAGYDLEALIGVCGQLVVVHQPSRKDPSRMFANVQTLMPLAKGMSSIQITPDYVRQAEREPAPSERGAEVEVEY